MCAINILFMHVVTLMLFVPFFYSSLYVAIEKTNRACIIIIK